MEFQADKVFTSDSHLQVNYWFFSLINECFLVLFIAQIPSIKTEVRRIIRVMRCKSLPISHLDSWYRDTIVNSSRSDPSKK